MLVYAQSNSQGRPTHNDCMLSMSACEYEAPTTFDCEVFRAGPAGLLVLQKGDEEPLSLMVSILSQKSNNRVT